MKYRKKPVVIDAVQWDGTSEALAAISDLGDRTITLDTADDSLAIDTLEGTMRANVGDFIIRGVKGELYPCKPDIFTATYDRADAQ